VASDPSEPLETPPAALSVHKFPFLEVSPSRLCSATLTDLVWHILSLSRCETRMTERQSHFEDRTASFVILGPELSPMGFNDGA
jgi:hypothetical protein